MGNVLHVCVDCCRHYSSRSSCWHMHTSNVCNQQKGHEGKWQKRGGGNRGVGEGWVCTLPLTLQLSLQVC